MARPLRIEYPGALYHVTSRGDRRECIYGDDGDRRLFLNVLESAVGRFRWVCHAYCLMDNHYHLLVETPEANLSRGMRQLNGVYTQQYNVRHEKSGHVFQGRYKAVVIEKDSHLLEVCRYVVLNPVRARVVTHPQQWKWSSYRATAGLVKGVDFLTKDWTLLQFGRRTKAAQRAYRRFVREGLDAPSPWEDVRGGLLLGGEEFVAWCRGAVAGDTELDEVPREQRLLGRPALADLFAGMNPKDKEQRNKAIACAYLEHGYYMKEIAAFLGIHYRTVSYAVAEQEGRIS